MIDNDTINDIEQRVINPIEHRTIEYLSKDAKININDTKKSYIKFQALALYEYSVSIAISGTANGSCIMSFDKGVLAHIVKIFVGDVDDDFINSLVADTACEVLNIVLGNSTHDIEKSYLKFAISPPCIPDNIEFIKEQLSQKEMILYEYDTELGRVLLGYLDNEIVCSIA
jgi:CheY-specific phosphatase CheX